MDYSEETVESIGNVLDALAIQYCGGHYDELIKIQAMIIRQEAGKQTDSNVQAFMMDAAKQLEYAAFAFYMSYK